MRANSRIAACQPAHAIDAGKRHARLQNSVLHLATLPYLGLKSSILTGISFAPDAQLKLRPTKRDFKEVTMRPNMMVGAICLMSVAAFAACQPSQSLDASAKDAEPLKLEAAPPAAKAAPTKAATKKAVAKSDAKAPAVSKAIATDTASTPVTESRVVAAKQDEEQPISTTVTGCLELRDDGMFQLKDTDGEHAPKARSWKSGFIKKSSAKVDVFDAGNRLKLGTHVGYRVSISGTLADRELRARTLRATSEACE